MAEYTEKRWQCDFCTRNAKSDTNGWLEVVLDFYGNTSHSCDRQACIFELLRFVKREYPSAYDL